MKSTASQLTAGAMVLAITAAVYSQEKPAVVTPAAPAPAPAKTTAPSPTLVNSWLRKESDAFKAWDIGGQVRLRYENFDNASPAFPNRDFQKSGVENDNSFLLLREKLHVGYTAPWFGAYVEGRDSSSTGDISPTNPSSDEIDLHQAYVTLGNPKQFPVSLKAGRQEMTYGDERVIGVSDWNNTGRVFDAVKLRYEDANMWVDGFMSRTLTPDDNNFNLSDDYDMFSGIYASSKTLLPFQESQMYFLARNTGVGTTTSPRDLYTIGLRMKSLPNKLKGWDYTVEWLDQMGSINSGGKRLDQDAMALCVNGGYTWTKTFGSPRVGLEYNYSSGDSNPNDNKSETLDPLFGTNHKLFGYMDYVSWRNIHAPRLTSSLKPWKPLLLTLDYYLYWLADNHDSFYPQSGSGRNANGYGRNPQYSSFIGSELNLDATYTINSWASIRAGYGHFFIGDYIKQSKAAVGGATDADWIYVQTTFTF
jgi:hypothetical protein